MARPRKKQELLITRTYTVNEDRYLEAVLILLGREDEIYELRERLRKEPQEDKAEEPPQGALVPGAEGSR